MKSPIAWVVRFAFVFLFGLLSFRVLQAAPSDGYGAGGGGCGCPAAKEDTGKGATKTAPSGAIPVGPSAGTGTTGGTGVPPKKEGGDGSTGTTGATGTTGTTGSTGGSASTGGGTPPPDKTPPTATCKSPTAGQKDAEPKTPITVGFTNDMDPATINSTTFVVSKAGGGAILGSVTYAAKTATFTPFERMDLASSYQVKVSSSVKDKTGKGLDKDMSCDFSTRDGKWDSSKPLEGVVGNANFPRIAGSFSKGAMVVWKQQATESVTKVDHWHIWASYFDPDPTGKWDAPVRLDGNDSSDGDFAQVSVDPDGSLFSFVWQEDESPKVSKIWGRSWDLSGGTSWLDSKPIILSNPLGSLNTKPQIAIDQKGEMAVIWQLGFTSPAYSMIRANQYMPEKGWLGYSGIPSVSYMKTGQYGPQIVLPEYGTPKNSEAIAVWYQFDYDATGTTDVFWSRKKDWAAKTWTDGRKIAKSTGDTSPQLALSSTGVVFAVWKHFEATKYQIFASSLKPGAMDWETPVRLDNLDGKDEAVSDIDIAAGRDGSAIATWSQHKEGKLIQIFARAFDPISAKWGEVKRLDTTDSDARYPQVAMDDEGRAFVVWESVSGPTSQIESSRFIRDSSGAFTGTWGSPQVVDKDVTAGDEGHFPHIVVDPKGAIAVWEGCGSTACTIYANQFE